VYTLVRAIPIIATEPDSEKPSDNRHHRNAPVQRRNIAYTRRKECAKSNRRGYYALAIDGESLTELLELPTISLAPDWIYREKLIADGTPEITVGSFHVLER
jgi:hypothetical protein